jgi:hypothetical protein
MATIQTVERAATAASDAVRPPRHSHPCSEYWDHATAHWRAAPLIPVPRRGA